MITICATALLFSTMCLNVNASTCNYVYSDDPFEIKNKEAKQKMESYLIMRDSSRNVQNDDERVLDTSQLDVKNISDFIELTKVADDNISVETLYTYDDENVKNIIAYDSTDSSYIMLEQDMVNNTATITVNYDTYAIVQNDNNIYIESQNGGVLPVYEEFDDPLTGTPLIPAEGQEVKNVDGDTPIARTSWKLLGGPYHKTSKMTFEVLEIISYIGSGASLYVHGPLGAVVFISSVVVGVGKTLSPTVHIKYYQYGASDCLSYIREKKYYYGAYSELSNTYYEQITNKNGSAKVTYSYFHSQRPENTGNPACMKY